MNETINVSAQPLPIQSVAVRETQPAQFNNGTLAVQQGLFGASEPADVVRKAVAVAQALKDVIKRQGLISSIQGKEYPRCEAWTLLGTIVGVFPVLVWTKPVDGGWEARVEAKTKDGAVVGAAEAQCLKTERNWANRDDFALRSMAQTRATAKCLRMPLGFVMTLAGYEPTPAEEMAYEPPRPKTTITPHTEPKNAPQAKETPPKAVYANDSTRTWMVTRLEPCRAEATEYFQKCDQLLDTEGLEDLPLRFVPIDGKQMLALTKAIGRFAVGDPADVAFEPNPEKVAAGKVEVRRDPDADPNSLEAAWRYFVVPFGKHAGVKLADLDKAVLFGFWANFKVETEYQGKARSAEQIKKDTEFRNALTQSGLHYEFRDAEDRG